MEESGGSKGISGPDGARRQEVAASLWSAWQREGYRAAVLTGFSGLGKTEHVVRPLVDRASAQGVPAVLIKVPLHPTDLDSELSAHLLEALQNDGDGGLWETIRDEPSFSASVRRLLQAGGLLVLDEFQRVLDSASGRPVGPTSERLHNLAQRGGDTGCLWLVSNREIDPTWTEPFFTALLEPPTELSDQQHIVMQAVGTSDAHDRFPVERRVEVIRRLGANPRILRLLGQLLRHYSLNELLGPPGDMPVAPIDPWLTEAIERELLAKAKEGISHLAGVLLRDLTILPEDVEWALLEAVGAPLGDVRALSRELRERFLLEVVADRFGVHPIVREVEGLQLRRDGTAWRAAHRRAGEWYARPLIVAKGPIADAELVLRLAGARYHLVEAEATSVLGDAVQGLRQYIERKFGWTSRRPDSDAERDARISLLALYLEQPGSTGVEYSYAMLLKQRGLPGDLEKALPHAERATVRQRHSDPWVLWIQIVRDLEGLDAALEAARIAAQHVAPAKNLYSVYQLLGALLDHLGRPVEAVNALLEGAKRGGGNEVRLIEEALFLAAAESANDLLERVHQWAEGADYSPELANVFTLERAGDWRAAAEAARRARGLLPTYIHLAMHESLGWIGAGDPQMAQEAHGRFPLRWNYQSRHAVSWLASLIALQRGDLATSSRFLATYLNEAAPSSATGIRAVLLREWDHRVATVGEPNPALTFPILPPAVTGLEANAYRPQYGPPVLPQHQGPQAQPDLRPKDPPSVLVCATEWSSSHGGLSTFNRHLCRALAAAGAQVVCLVLDVASGEIRQIDGVNVVGAIRTAGSTEQQALMRKPSLPEGFTPDIVIGHGRVTGPAAHVLVEDHYTGAKRLHFVHVAPDEIEWYKPDREDDAGLRAEERTQIELQLSGRAAHVVAVGPRLHNRYLRDLSSSDIPVPLRMDPGFDAPTFAARTPPPGEPWLVLLVARLEDSHLKGLDIAARAVGLAVERRGTSARRLELLVRGARPDTSEELRRSVREWAGPVPPDVVVRPYAADTERLDADLRRASLVLMPSRSEGFGLVGLEAIVAGTPVLVSAESGLGELLRGALEQEQASRLVVPVSDDEEVDRDKWGNAVISVLRDRDAAFRRAAEVRAQLGKEKTWAAAIAGLIAELEA